MRAFFLCTWSRLLATLLDGHSLPDVSAKDVPVAAEKSKWWCLSAYAVGSFGVYPSLNSVSMSTHLQDFQLFLSTTSSESRT